MSPSTRRPSGPAAGGGATWANLDGATQAHGLAVTGGAVSHTGIAGLTLGGGMGWLTLEMGLSADNLVGADVVTADGSLVHACADDHPDLFWALRGGGGNFGVVTSFEYQLGPVGPLVNLSLFFWAADQGAEALRLSRDVIGAVPRGFGALLACLSAPPAPFVPEQHHFAPGYALLIAGLGSAEDHARVIEPARAALTPLFELVTPIPYTALQQMLDEASPWGIHAYEKALYLDDLTDGAIAVITEHAHLRQSPMSFMPVFPFGGAYAEVPDDATAFGGSRRARFAFNITAPCPDPELFDAERAWVRSFWEALRPHSSGLGSYVNFMSEYEEDRVRAAYGAEKYDRLTRIKAEYDPDNVFHLNANIKPALAPA